MGAWPFLKSQAKTLSFFLNGHATGHYNKILLYTLFPQLCIKNSELLVLMYTTTKNEIYMETLKITFSPQNSLSAQNYQLKFALNC